MVAKRLSILMVRKSMKQRIADCNAKNCTGRIMLQSASMVELGKVYDVDQSSLKCFTTAYAKGFGAQILVK